MSWNLATGIRVMLGMLLVFALAAPLPAAESGDYQLFIDGFDAYQRDEYGIAVEKLNRVIKEYPGSPLRDMSLFWLARASYRTGDLPGAARAMSLFLKEYPDHPLKGSVEDSLLKLAARHDRGEIIASAPAPPPQIEPDAEPLQQATPPREPRPHPEPAVPTPPERSAVAQAPASAAPAPVSTTPPPIAEPAAASRSVVASTPPPAVVPTVPVTPSTIPASLPVAPPPPTVPPPAAASTTETTAPIVIAAAKTSEATNRDAAIAQASQSAGTDRTGSHDGNEVRRRLNLQERAVAEYRTTIKRYPGTPAAKEAEATIRKIVTERRLFDKGLREFRKGHYKSALASFDRYLKEYPDSPRAADATIYREECDAAQAPPAAPVTPSTIPASPPVATLPPTVPPPAAASTTEPTAPTIIAAAKTSEATNRDAAIAQASQSAKADRKGPRGGKELGRRLDLQEQAVAGYRATIKRDPGTPAAKEAAAQIRKIGTERRLFDKGLREFRKGNYRSALASFNRYLKENPESPRAADATFYRGECFLNLSRR